MLKITVLKKVTQGQVVPYLTNIRLFAPTYFEQAHILPRIDFKGKCPAVSQLSLSLLTDVLLFCSPWDSSLLLLLHILKVFLDKKNYAVFFPCTSNSYPRCCGSEELNCVGRGHEGTRYTKVFQSFNFKDQ